MKYVTVAEIFTFQAAAKDVGLSDEERQELTTFLARNPQTGDVIPGTGGLRKLRWRGKGRGKRGGYRVIYYFYNETMPIFLFTIYSKSEQVDLTQDQKADFCALVETLKSRVKRGAA